MQFAKPWFLLGAFLLGLCVAASGAHAQSRGEDSERTITSGGMRREFILHVPSNAPPGPKPLVIALHGAWQPAGVMQRYLDLDKIADREGFVVAYPKGLNLLWNDGRATVAGIMPIIYPRDDGRFVLDVLHTLEKEGLADPSHAYLMGFSNGGFLTAYVACRYANSFAAFATMMMTVPVGYAESCKPARPVPILMMNGTYDPIVPMFGRPTPGARLMSATDSANLFARLDSCAPPVETRAPHARILRWEQCTPGSAVALYEIAGGHQPPSQSTDAMDALAAIVLGPRRSGLDAPQEIWNFFKRFDNPTVTPPQTDAPLVAQTPSGTVAAPAALAAPVAATMAAPEPIAPRPAVAARGAAPILSAPTSYATAWQGIAPASGADAAGVAAPVPLPTGAPASAVRVAAAPVPAGSELHKPMVPGAPMPLQASFHPAGGATLASSFAEPAQVPLPPPSPLRRMSASVQ
ncbi:poly(3-hydroxybutyrate) depolymerase-like protein [Ancylobacter sp. MQZ15Z-1]|uniref:Poly(3-hydroxybutyrate) depolymerase-like protein n=1 Tax=Ancylobacter mangrovi TaxID=2972472 RepID=A0A9X2PGS2_9HYPH|nr:PHB depolymerase family esterase [Ancylobacter mangrovi]MCS0496756.1 poly(3-hydroxybutyrate) depolymerase-like protein [Ancylobacter mangrovi]